MIPSVAKSVFLSLFPRRTAEDLRRRYRAIFKKGPRVARPVFVLGVGAQKAGTSWLHDYLSSHPSADMGFTKEYHVFDGLFITDPEVRQEFLDRRLERLRSFGGKAPYEDRLIVDMIADLDVYFSYFESLSTIGKTVYLTGDISPCYSALPVGVYSLVRNNLLARGMRPRVIFMMRDPVERCISAARMILRNTDHEVSAASENELIEKIYTSPYTTLRSRYDRTIPNLEAVFPPEELHYVFYEEFFSDESIQALTDFLDIEYVPGEVGRMVNVSRTGNVIDEELRRKMCDHFEPIYRFAKNRFGKERIQRLWEGEKEFGPA